jgi:hypothetical protein
VGLHRSHEHEQTSGWHLLARSLPRVGHPGDSVVQAITQQAMEITVITAAQTESCRTGALQFDSPKQCRFDGAPILRSNRYQGASGAVCGLVLLRHRFRARSPTSAASNIAGQAQHSARAYWIGCSRSIIRYTCGQTPSQLTMGTDELKATQSAGYTCAAWDRCGTALDEEHHSGHMKSTHLEHVIGLSL